MKQQVSRTPDGQIPFCFLDPIRAAVGDFCISSHRIASRPSRRTAASISCSALTSAARFAGALPLHRGRQTHMMVTCDCVKGSWNPSLINNIHAAQCSVKCYGVPKWRFLTLWSIMINNIHAAQCSGRVAARAVAFFVSHRQGVIVFRHSLFT